MPSVLAYYRPGSLDEASTLLAAPHRTALGGGTVAVPAARMLRDEGVELVDLQALGLDAVGVDGDSVSLGAMARLGDIVEDERLPLLLRDLAKRELPSALRNQATIGGTVALGEPTSVLVAGLLVYGADVLLHSGGVQDLEAVLAAGVADDIITAITLNGSGAGAIVATGRTPADEPIVAAVGLSSIDGVRLALTGVAPAPVLVDPKHPTSGLDPAGDFRGSSAYRVHLAGVLSSRVLEEVSR